MPSVTLMQSLVVPLKQLCESNSVGWLVSADEYALDELRALCLEFVRRRFRRIRMIAKDSLALLTQHPGLMLEVMDTPQAL